MSKRDCPRSTLSSGNHRYEPIEDGKLVRDEYLGGYAAARWSCAYCGKVVRFDGRYAITPRRS